MKNLKTLLMVLAILLIPLSNVQAVYLEQKLLDELNLEKELTFREKILKLQQEINNNSKTKFEEALKKAKLPKTISQ